MALVACSACGHQVSDKAGSVCPACGAPSGPSTGRVKGHYVVAVTIAGLGAVTFAIAPPPYGPFVGGLIMICGLIAALG